MQKDDYLQEACGLEGSTLSEIEVERVSVSTENQTLLPIENASEDKPHKYRPVTQDHVLPMLMVALAHVLPQEIPMS